MHGLESARFRPTLDALFASIKADPKQYPLKSGKLQGHRAASVRFNRNAEWRCVFSIDEKQKIVDVSSLGPHDEAYAKAERVSR